MTASFVRPVLLGDGPLFPVTLHSPRPTWQLALDCVARGLAAGAMSGILTKGVYLFEDLFQRLPIHWMWWPAIGGVAIGLGGLVEPRALGVGYEVIEAALNGQLIGRALIVKAAIWVISLGSGTSGGVLAPLLIMGACLGGLEALVLPGVGVGFWPLVSMAAIPAARFFPSRAVQLGWVVWNIALAVAMIALGWRWRHGLARALACATLLDAVLSILEVLADAGRRARDPLDGALMAIGCLGPALATSLLWGSLARRPRVD